MKAIVCLRTIQIIMKVTIDKEGNWICPLCTELFDANDDWMATKYKHHMVIHARRGQIVQ